MRPGQNWQLPLCWQGCSGQGNHKEHRRLASAGRQNAAAEAIQKLKSDELARCERHNGKTREVVKGSYSRGLAERLRAKA
jgi:hypothetical protein